MNPTISLLVLGLLGGSLQTSFAADPVQLSLNPPAQAAKIGIPFELTLDISGLASGGPESLGAFDLDVHFDASAVQFQGVGFGDPALGDQLDLGGLGSISGFDDSIPGVLNLFDLSLDDAADLDALQATDFTLATLTFTGLTEGSTTLMLTVNALGNAVGAPLDPGFLPATVGLTMAGPPAVVPEGSARTVLPALLGLMVAAWWSGRRR